MDIITKTKSYTIDRYESDDGEVSYQLCLWGKGVWLTFFMDEFTELLELFKQIRVCKHCQEILLAGTEGVHVDNHKTNGNGTVN